MFSTAEDMVRFIMANVGVSTINGKTIPQEVLDGMVQALEPRTSMHNPESNLRQAFAWIVLPENQATNSQIRGKDGGLPGVSAYLSVNPELQYGVILMLNMQGVKVQNSVLGLMEGLREIVRA